MRMSIEVFTLVLVVAIGTIMMSSMITVSAQNAEARGYFDVVRNRIEDSAGNESVVRECVNEAKEKGYELQIRDMAMSETGRKLILMKYKIDIPIYKIIGNKEERECILEGYAR